MHSSVVTLVSVSLLLRAAAVTSQNCNNTHADICVREMETVLNTVIETATTANGAETLEGLCLNTIKGNNLTQCYIDATSGCNPQGTQAPSRTAQRWERVMQDIYKLCDGACPRFLERTINITQCTSLIRFDALHESSFGTFCTSLNNSLDCAAQVTQECPMFGRLFYDLLPQGVDATASTICTAGCANFDEAMTVLDSCKSHVLDLPEDLDAACRNYGNFKTCLHTSQVPVTCPMFEALMEVLYPQHIFGLYEQQCNRTWQGDASDECGEIGRARVQHCVRVLALAWPSTIRNPTISEQTCRDYETGLRCLDNAGFHRCASLRQFFHNMTNNRRENMDILQDACVDFLTGQRQVDGEKSTASVNKFPLTIMMVALSIVLWLSLRMTSS